MFAFGLEKDRRFPGLVDWLLSLQGRDGAFPCPSKAGSPFCVFATALFLRLAEGMGDDPRRRLCAASKCVILEAYRSLKAIVESYALS